MKILHLITDLDVGGAEVMLHNLVKEHNKNGIQMHVVGMAGEGLIGEQIKQLGTSVSYLGMKPDSIDPRPLVSLNKICKNFKPDVIQTWMYHADLVGSLMALKNRTIPVVWGIHHTLGGPKTMSPATNNIVSINAILSHWLPKKVICCSSATLRSHIKKGFNARKMVVIKNGIDLERFQIDKSARHSVRTELGLDPDIPLIGMLARFHPQKDHQSLILAAAHLHLRFPEVHFVLAGKDIQPGNSKLEKWIHSAGLINQFHLLGLRTDTSALLAALDIATLSSSSGEALPVFICEAMACGIPCVVTDVGDSRDLVGSTGICVDPGNPMELADGWGTILSLKTDLYAQLGIQARHRIESEYNMIEIANRYYDIYKSVIS